MDEKALHESLLRPVAYPEKTKSVFYLETHISRLYLTDSHVYKIKKPLNLGFLDFTSLEKRLFFCREEIRLNRRFCPDTYLQVLPVRATGQSFSLGGNKGEIVEYAVQMKKLPKGFMLDTLLFQNDPSLAREIQRLAPYLAAIHRQAPRLAEIAPDLNDRESIEKNWRDNFLQTEPFSGQSIPPVALQTCRGIIEGTLHEKSSLFERRQHKGFVREVHGDLHAEHICLTDPIKIYDCIEFSQKLRLCDVLSDLAFLLMDLEFRGRRDLAELLLTTYLDHSESHPEHENLIPFYKTYRAWVRGKVESIAMSQHKPDEQAFRNARNLAGRYFNLAMGYYVSSFLVITCGLMGSGKSVVSRGLRQATGAALIQSDAVRKELQGLPAMEKAAVAFETGIYCQEATSGTYDELRIRAAHELQKGHSVIVDASFAKEGYRQKMAALAKDHGVTFLIVNTLCEESIQRKRLKKRSSEGTDISDGRPELAAKQAENFDKLAENSHSIKVDTCREVEYTVGLVLNRLLQKNEV